MDESHFSKLRNAFFSGLLLVAPLAVTIWAFVQVVAFVGGNLRPLYDQFLPLRLRNITFFWDILATLIVFGFVTLLGYISRYFLGKYILGVGERFIQSIPGVHSVYNTVKQIVQTFSSQNRNLFSKVVLVEFPRPGVHTIAFLTNKTRGEPQAHSGDGEVWTVFVPTSPNPTSGFLLMVPKDQVTELEMSVGDGMKMVISGGAVMPPWTAVDLPQSPGAKKISA